MKDYLILRVTAKFTIPFIILFALYIQVHADYSPGGGFQAGVVLASAFIVYALVFGLSKAERLLSTYQLKLFACLGVLVYAGVGIATLVLGGQFLNYSVLAPISTTGQQLGIFLVELGVGLTVFSVILLLYFILAKRKG